MSKESVTISRENLLPCPFCGGDAHYEELAKDVHCSLCGIVKHYIVNWNNRKGEKEQEQEQESIIKDLNDRIDRADSEYMTCLEARTTEMQNTIDELRAENIRLSNVAMARKGQVEGLRVRLKLSQDHNSKLMHKQAITQKLKEKNDGQ